MSSKCHSNSADLERKKKAKFFVEMVEGRMTGSISAIINENMAELRDFYIVEGPEDSGLRSILLEKALKYCEKHDIHRVRAIVFPDISRLFKKKGFKREKVVRDRFILGEELLVMTKTLD